MTLKKKDLRTGDLIAFQIGATDGFSAPHKDHWGVAKVLDLGNPNDSAISISVAAQLWPKRPTKWQAFRAPVLIEKRFLRLGNTRPPEALIFTTPYDAAIALPSARIIGTTTWFNRAERAARDEINAHGYYFRFGTIEQAPFCLDHEHRALTDTDRWLTEIKADIAKQEKVWAQQAAREKSRLKKITLQVLHAETRFPEWDQRAQIVPPAFASDVRRRSDETIAALAALGPKPKRKDVRVVLRAYMAGLDAANGQHGYWIETEERQDLLDFVEELCWATRQKPLFAEAADWRDW